MKTRRERTALSAGHSGRFVIQCSSSRAGDAPPVRHEDQKVRVRLDEFAPIKPRRVLIVFTQNVLSSCDLDQLGTQFPAVIGGSIHSIHTTLGRSWIELLTVG